MNTKIVFIFSPFIFIWTNFFIQKNGGCEGEMWYGLSRRQALHCFQPSLKQTVQKWADVSISSLKQHLKSLWSRSFVLAAARRYAVLAFLLSCLICSEDDPPSIRSAELVPVGAGTEGVKSMIFKWTSSPFKKTRRFLETTLFILVWHGQMPAITSGAASPLIFLLSCKASAAFKWGRVGVALHSQARLTAGMHY